MKKRIADAQQEAAHAGSAADEAGRRALAGIADIGIVSAADGAAWGIPVISTAYAVHRWRSEVKRQKAAEEEVRRLAAEEELRRLAAEEELRRLAAQDARWHQRTLRGAGAVAGSAVVIGVAFSVKGIKGGRILAHFLDRVRRRGH